MVHCSKHEYCDVCETAVSSHNFNVSLKACKHGQKAIGNIACLQQCWLAEAVES